MITSGNPAVHRRKLASKIRALREGVKLTRVEVADSLECSVSKVIRIENGTSRININDLRHLLQLYGVAEPSDVEALLDTARADRSRQWWDRYRKDVTSETYTLLGLEASAARIDEYRTSTLPPLLQTPAYTAAFLRATAGEETVAPGVEVTSLRQAITAVGGPRLRFVLDEAVLRRRVGSVDTTRKQLQHLLEAARLNPGSIRVLPFRAKTAPVRRSSYALLIPPPQSFEPVVAFEHPLRDVTIVDDPQILQKQEKHFDAAWSATLDETESTRFIAAMAG